MFVRHLINFRQSIVLFLLNSRWAPSLVGGEDYPDFHQIKLGYLHRMWCAVRSVFDFKFWTYLNEIMVLQALCTKLLRQQLTFIIAKFY